MTAVVTVAIPVKDGGSGLERVLTAVAGQRLEAEVQMLICDSGSRDGSAALARRCGAEVFEIPPESFSHGGTRNLLMKRASGTHVAFLTQDAVPSGEGWLRALIAGFSLDPEVALAFGPYRARPGASVPVARELDGWFQRFAPDGAPRIDRLAPDQRGWPAAALLGPRGYFTDANGAIARAAWEEVPFRSIAYAEDHALAHDMLRAGYAKAYLPDAAVQHSHEYGPWGRLTRSYDEARALREVYGHVEPGGLRRNVLRVWGEVGADRRWAAGHALPAGPGMLARSTVQHTARTAGALLGSRSERLPPPLVRMLSRERRTD